jgi:hypothetical protein
MVIGEGEHGHFKTQVSPWGERVERLKVEGYSESVLRSSRVEFSIFNPLPTC